MISVEVGKHFNTYYKCPSLRSAKCDANIETSVLMSIYPNSTIYNRIVCPCTQTEK